MLVVGSLASHLESQHNVQHCYLDEAVCPIVFKSYEVLFIPVMSKWLCLVPNCPQVREGKGCSNKANI